MQGELRFRVPGTLSHKCTEIHCICPTDISVVRYAFFEQSEGKEEGCSSKMREY
jgi:hypothetical protein